MRRARINSEKSSDSGSIEPKSFSRTKKQTIDRPTEFFNQTSISKIFSDEYFEAKL